MVVYCHPFVRPTGFAHADRVQLKGSTECNKQLIHNHWGNAMSGDLERFLQQAAERLKQKLDQANQPAQPPKPPPPVRQAERARPVLQAEPADEVLEAQVIELPRSAGANPLSNLDTRPALAQQIGLADERMAGHLQEVFDHPVSKIKQASAALEDSSVAIAGSSEVRVRAKQSSPMVEMLRNPQTLRAAFIASEIFARRP